MTDALKEKLLVWLLRLGAVMTIAAFPTALLPTKTMIAVHEWLGMGTFPDAPVTQYMARSLALMYGFHGVMTAIVSTDVRRYRPFVTYLGWMMLTLGPAMTLLDLYAGLPMLWVWAEGPPLFATGCVVLWLRRAVPVAS